MELKFNGKRTKVQQLTDYLQNSISANELKVGDKLPSINVLSKRFGVSRDTVFKSFSDLKSRGIIDSIHGKNYYVAGSFKNILLLLDEYSPFKEVLYNTIVSKLPQSYRVDLWFHQYNLDLFNKIISDSAGKYNKYLVMNYDNEKLSEVLTKINKKKTLLLDFGKFEKNAYSYVCQNFDDSLYKALETIKSDLKRYKKLIFLFNKKHKHPQSSKQAFSQFCFDNNMEFNIIYEFKTVCQDCFYLAIKPEDVVSIIKGGKAEKMSVGKDFGLLAYNENPFFEVIGDGISSIGIDWEEMGMLAADFVLSDNTVQKELPTIIRKRNSF